MLLTQDERIRLKRHVAIYSTVPTRLMIEEESDKHYTSFEEHKAIIILGTHTPYHYTKHLHEEGYNLFMEGLNFHEIAKLTYTDYKIMFDVYQDAKEVQKQANEQALAYTQKKIKAIELKQTLYNYVRLTNLPLLLNALEDGAVENSMGIEHPETWNALMFARIHMTNLFINNTYNVKDQSFLMDKIIHEIMVICTYGYRFSLKKSIVYLPHYLNEHFESIRKLAIIGRLQSQTTAERLALSHQILDLCHSIIEKTTIELLDTITKTPQFSQLPPNLFSKSSEISVSFGKNQQTQEPQRTKSKYKIDINNEEFQHIEAIEDQKEKDIQHQVLQEILKKEKETQQRKDKNFKNEISDSQYLNSQIIYKKLEYIQPTKYGSIALRTKNQSIARSNKLARMLKRERMYASKSTTKHKLEYGRKLDQQNLYRATLDGRVFMEHKEGEKKDLCVYILVDNSESMSGDKIINTMKGCYELARVLQTLNIPFCISAHKSIGGTTVQMTEIISFQECKKRNVLERIFAMHVSGGTHEDIALEYVLKQLSEYKRKKKGFVFVLSDGDTHGVKRIHELTKLYKKEKDIDIVGIGIQTAPMITTTYPNSLFIKDINTLPDMLIKKLREIAL